MEDMELQAMAKATVREALAAADEVGRDQPDSFTPRPFTSQVDDSKCSLVPACATSGAAHDCEGAPRSRVPKPPNQKCDRSAIKHSLSNTDSKDADALVSSLADNLDVVGQPHASLKLHKAQIRALEGDVNAAREEVASLRASLRDAQAKLKAATTEQAAMSKKMRAQDARIAKLHSKEDDLKGQLAARELELRQVSHDIASTERSQRATEGDLKARGARLNRALEEVQRYRALLEEVKSKESAQRSVAIFDHQQLLAEHRKLEGQKAELLVAFRKQAKLIDVLKRQKIHMQAAQMLKFTEQEFMRTLEPAAAATV